MPRRQVQPPFPSILRDFYARAAKDARLRFLGLTASPLNSNEGLEEAERLQDLLDAKGVLPRFSFAKYDLIARIAGS